MDGDSGVILVVKDVFERERIKEERLPMTRPKIDLKVSKGVCVQMARGEQEDIVLYGAGTQNLRLAYQPITAAGYHVVAICDKDEKKQGQMFYGITVISPEELAALDRSTPSYTVVITIRTAKTVDKVREQLKGLKNAKVYRFEEFFSEKKLNCTIQKINQVQTHVVDHCNLDCVRCTHLSPLADRSFYLDKEEFERDIIQLSKLTGGDVEEYQLAGGEPLLHPECHVFPYIIRKWLPNTRIIIITNGTLFDRVGEEFYESCRVNRVQLWITVYPIAKDYKKIAEILTEKGIDFVMGNSGNTDNEPKEMWGVAYNLSGDLDGQKNFEECFGRCVMIRNGRIYLCTQGAYSDLFNQYFHKELPGPEENGVDLYEVNTLEELTNRLARKIPFCDYCDTLGRMPPIPWGISKKEIGEWVKEEADE